MGFNSSLFSLKICCWNINKNTSLHQLRTQRLKRRKPFRSAHLWHHQVVQVRGVEGNALGMAEFNQRKDQIHTSTNVWPQNIHTTSYSKTHSERKAGQHQFTCNTTHKQQNWPCMCSGSHWWEANFSDYFWTCHNIIKMSQTKNIDTEMLKLTEEHNPCHFAHKYKTLYIQKETSFLTETLDFYTHFSQRQQQKGMSDHGLNF